MKKLKFNKELHTAAREADLQALTTLLQQGADINEIGPHGWPLLIHAVHSGDVEVVRFLLDSGADPDSTDSEAKNAMHHAAMRGRTEVVRFLIERGFAVDTHENYRQYTPLHLLCAHSPRDTDQATATLLLDAGAQIDARTKDGSTALMSAVFSSRVEFVRFLLNAGANINAATDSGVTPLILSVQWGVRSKEVLRDLLERGADVNAQDTTGKSALMKAVWETDEDVLNLLLDYGATIDLQDAEGKTALMHASMPSAELSLRWLLMKRDQEADKPDPTGKRQIRLEAAWQRRADIVRLLRNRGADPTVRDASGKTALDWAQEQESGKAVVEVLQ